MPPKVRKLLAARIAPRCSGGLRSCMNAASGTSNKPAADAQQHQKRAGDNVAERVFVAGVDQFAFDRIKQEGEQDQSAGTERQNAQLDFAAGPEAGQHAAEPDADDQRRQQRRRPASARSRRPRTQIGRCSAAPTVPSDQKNMMPSATRSMARSAGEHLQVAERLRGPCPRETCGSGRPA